MIQIPAQAQSHCSIRRLVQRIPNDAGGDGTFERMAERLKDYHGPHRLELLVCQSRNLGVAGHCNAVLPRASGDIVVMMAGDDISRPDRVEKLLAAYAENPGAMAIASGFRTVDDRGQPIQDAPMSLPPRFGLSTLLKHRRLDSLLGATLSFRREVFARFGALHGSVEDNALTLRASLLGECLILPDVLVDYRQHGGSVSHGIFARGVAGEDAAELARQRLRRTAHFMMGTAEDFAHAIECLPELSARRRYQAHCLQHRYAATAAMRAALADDAFAPRWRALCFALSRPGMRLRALEYVGKLWRRA